MNALVIDDSKAMRTILKGILKNLGFNVFEAGDGVEALEQMNSVDDIVLALVDWNMPNMNGFDFVKEVRSSPVFDSTKLMMVTTEAEMQRVIAAIEAGADEYLMKPFTRDAVLEKLGILGIRTEG
ncbi:MAG: two-component system chemotaxis response regulator CheY [Candidatus Paceibacteria bacterium]|jgi:two-component system chemotaxis response regulator CheY